MKLVYRVDRINLKLVQVPEDALECSVCGHWKPCAEFCDDEGRMIRTNCESCYNMPLNEFRALSGRTKTQISAKRYEIHKLEDECSMYNSVVTKAEFIKKIVDGLAGLNDDDLIYPYTEGYDCDGIKEETSMDDISFNVNAYTPKQADLPSIHKVSIW